jgi:DNA-binding MarR family transcriptional regulator
MPGTAAPPTSPVEALVRQIYGLGRVRREISRHALAELGSQGFTALAIVHRDGPVRISEVAHRLAVDLSVASRQIAALADAGYVTRERDSADRRAQVVEATEDGRRVLIESHKRMVDAFAEVLGDWSDADLAELTERLSRLNDSFSNDA